MAELLQTPLHAWHQRSGAKMVPFAGYEMPLQYSGIVDEHLQVRSKAGLFDVSHMARLRLRGDEVISYCQNLTVNNVRKLRPGGGQYSLLCLPDGGCIDDITLYMESETSIVMISNAARKDRVLPWLEEHRPVGVEIDDLTDETALIAFQGPLTASLLAKLNGTLDLGSMKLFSFTETTLRIGEEIPVWLARSGYTGELGCEIMVDRRQAEKLWSHLESFDGVGAIGLGARDSLRLEMGYMLYGNDIDESTSPLEAGLTWVVKLDADPFIGKEVLEDQKSAGLGRRLVGLVGDRRTIPRRGYELKVDGVTVGHVTSGGYSPTLQKGIGLAYLDINHVKRAEVDIDIRGRMQAVTVGKPPFVQINS